MICMVVCFTECVVEHPQILQLVDRVALVVDLRVNSITIRVISPRREAKDTEAPVAVRARKYIVSLYTKKLLTLFIVCLVVARELPGNSQHMFLIHGDKSPPMHISIQPSRS
jgi:hypothetical protein